MTVAKLPRHIAIIPDGNGRWARQRFLPRVAGHKAGADAVKRTIEACVEKRIEVLTIFAFSSENWQRPPQEVNYLMDLFVTMLEKEVGKLHKQNIQLQIIGDESRFSPHLQLLMKRSMEMTAKNTGLKLVIAANYGGRWDLKEALKKISQEIEAGKLTPQHITQELIQSYLTLGNLPEPDLLIRTSGEQRISNFFLWQLAYTELYFSKLYWPDFNAEELNRALDFFSYRERRFGCTPEQINSVNTMETLKVGQAK